MVNEKSWNGNRLYNSFLLMCDYWVVSVHCCFADQFPVAAAQNNFTQIVLDEHLRCNR